jgi:hypothetical protein
MTPESIQVLMETLKDQYTIVAAINGDKASKWLWRTEAGSHSWIFDAGWMDTKCAVGTKLTSK